MNYGVRLVSQKNFDFKKCYVAFIDVLGFRNMIQAEKVDAKVGQYFNLVDQLKAELSNSFAIKSASISDSLVLCMECVLGSER